jgi:ribosomal protein L11 methyltransferase
MHYDEIRIELAAAQADGLSDWLVGQGLGFQQADETTLDPPPPGRVRFHLYVPQDDSEAVLGSLREVIPDPASAVEVRDRDEDEWRDAWKRYFHTRRIGRLALVPSWEAAAHAPADGEVTLSLDPGRAFGTGGHPSTRLCLRLIDELAAAGPLGDALDVGCGCGVLAIAALLYEPGARGLAVDIDPESLEVTRENAEKNGVEGRLRVEGTDVAAVPEVFPLVLANLSGPTLRELAAPIRRRLAPGGRLVLSGILTEEAGVVAERFVAEGLTLLREEREDEWSALLLGDGPAPAVQGGAGGPG